MLFFFGLFVSRFSFPPYAILFFSFLLGFFTLGIIAIYFTAVSKLVTKEYVGVVTGLALIFPRTSTVITPPLFGLIADIKGTYALSWVVLGTIILLTTLVFIYCSGKNSLSSSTKYKPDRQ